MRRVHSRKWNDENVVSVCMSMNLTNLYNLYDLIILTVVIINKYECNNELLTFFLPLRKGLLPMILPSL